MRGVANLQVSNVCVCDLSDDHITYSCSALPLFMITKLHNPSLFFFFFKDRAPPEISPLPLHDALPIPRARVRHASHRRRGAGDRPAAHDPRGPDEHPRRHPVPDAAPRMTLPLSFPPQHALLARSEEHTSELQSQSNLVCRLLLEKKKKN